jgi:hypothetical protein
MLLALSSLARKLLSPKLPLLSRFPPRRRASIVLFFHKRGWSTTGPLIELPLRLPDSGVRGPVLPDAVELVSELKVLVFFSAECAGGGGRDTREGPVLVRRRSGKGDFVPVAIWWISGGVGGPGLSSSYTNDRGGALGC